MPTLDIESLKPADTPDYMIPAWLGCVRWAASDPATLHEFMHEAGVVLPKSPLDSMIDAATGREQAIVKQFIEWVNGNVWGPMDGGEVSRE